MFSYEVDYDEFVNEFYLYVMENDAYRLRQFQGRSSIYQWMKVVAIRYFIAKRDGMIDNDSKEAEPKVVAHELRTNVDNLYNIKKRAVAALTEIALNDLEKYEKGISK